MGAGAAMTLSAAGCDAASERASVATCFTVKPAGMTPPREAARHDSLADGFGCDAETPRGLALDGALAQNPAAYSWDPTEAVPSPRTKPATGEYRE